MTTRIRDRAPVRLDLEPVSLDTVETLERELGCSHVLAQVLARRGFADPPTASAFMEGAEAHAPGCFAGMGTAVELVRRHLDRGSTITIHGDYDCDGVCATAVLVGALRELGADVDWYLPDRRADGYGLAAATVARLIERGTDLLVTADCAITAVDEVAAARAGGMDVLVTDHHRPRADGRLPDAPHVHPSLGGYPCPQLCATAVAAKLAQALREAAGAGGGERDCDLELVAIATMADVVALHGENRRLVRAGLRALACTTRPGLRALLEVARVAPMSLDERAIAFRLAPRINAAGRMYTADTALELLLTQDAGRAGALAAELDRANAERRAVETRIRFEAEALVAAEPDDAAAYVLAAAGWHPGVIGIVAARIAERHHRPVVLIAAPESGEGTATGSARSIPSFDLLAGLSAAAEHLERYGGHRAAAGLTVDARHIDAFRRSFIAHASATLAPEDLVARERVDAVASGEDIGLTLAEELARLAPFGAGNPPVSLLLPAATLTDAVGFGGERREDHARFTVNSGGGSASAVRFGDGPRAPAAPDAPVDATFTLERHEWRGAVSPRLCLRSVSACEPGPIELLGEDGSFFDRVAAELDRALRGVDAAGRRRSRLEIDRRGRGIAALVTELLASGERMLVIAADARARLRHLGERLGGFALASHSALERDGSLGDGFPIVVALDPPTSHAAHVRLAACAPEFHRQRLYLAWGAAELRFAEHIHRQEYALRDSLAACYRVLRNRGGAVGRELETVLREGAPSPEAAGRVLRILTEVELVDLDRERWAVTVIPRGRVALERSPAYRTYEQIGQDGLTYLARTTAQQAAA
jgi:single-stranded-DNA-specific exonuclease